MKKTFILIFSVMALSILSLFSLYYFYKKNTSVNFPVSEAVNMLSVNRLKEGKVFEVILKDSVTDNEADKVLNELTSIEGINGNSLYTIENQKRVDYTFLYPQDIVTITPGSRVVIDLDVEKVSDKNLIIEKVKQNPNVDVVLNLMPR